MLQPAQHGRSSCLDPQPIGGAPGELQLYLGSGGRGEERERKKKRERKEKREEEKCVVGGGGESDRVRRMDVALDKCPELIVSGPPAKIIAYPCCKDTLHDY